MITKTLTIHCDHSECADADGYETCVSTNAEARQEAGRYDWACRGGRDLCPRHAHPTEEGTR